jgi:hypothetical protein
MRRFQQGEGEEGLQPSEPSVDRRGRARREQHDAAEKGRDGERLRDDLGHDATEESADAADDGAPEELVHAEQRAGRDQRHEVVDDAIRDERSEHRRARKMGRQAHQDDGLEDAEATGEMAREPGDLGEQERRQKLREAESRRGGEQYVEHARGERPVERRERELHQRQLERGNAELSCPADRRPTKASS